MKHGLSATEQLFIVQLQDREKKAFYDMLRKHYAEFEPFTDTEKRCVDRIAIQHFRLYRLYGVEYHSANATIKAPFHPGAMLAHLDRLGRYHNKIENHLKDLYDQIKYLKTHRSRLAHTSQNNVANLSATPQINNE